MITSPVVIVFTTVSYTVSELEVRNLKPLEMIEKPNNFGITCLYLQEYKKAFAFLTKFHYFYHKKLTNLTFERRKKKLKFFLGFLSIYDSKTCSNSKKSICSKNLKVLPIWNHYHCFDRTIFGDFIAIFEKNTTEKKNFFSNFCKSPFLIIIRRDLMKKIFFEISKKNFEKKIVFSNAECVVSGH